MNVTDEDDGGGDKLEIGLSEEHFLHAATDSTHKVLFYHLFTHYSLLDLNDVHLDYWIIQFTLSTATPLEH